jgi:hypothetical protein
MKTIYVAVLVCAIFTNHLFSQEIAAPVVDERGANFRKWERKRSITLPSGVVREQKSTVLQLHAGLHYRDPQTGEFKESRAIIEPHPDGAVARQGQHKAAFSSNLKTPGALKIGTDDGTVIQGHLLGVAFTDAESGLSAMIAEVKDSQGIITSDSTITYVNAMDSFLCNVVYTYRISGLEQDLVILEAPSVTPQELGMNPLTTRMELFFEVLTPPEARVKAQPIRSVLGRNTQKLTLGAFSDIQLEFGSMRFAPGKAFDAQGLSPAVPIGKSFIKTADGRTCLIEAIEYPMIQRTLEGLPKPQAANKKPSKQLMASRGKGGEALLARMLPPAPAKAQAAIAKPMLKEFKTAQLSPKLQKGLTWDFVVQLTVGVTNYVFRGDYTYWISGGAYLYGSNVISGGTVIKSSPGGILSFEDGSITCNTSPFYPAVLTASDDTTIGDYVGFGPLSGYYADIAISVASGVQGSLHDLKVKYAGQGFYLNSPLQLNNIELSDCYYGIIYTDSPTLTAGNILATRVGRALAFPTGNQINFQHLSADSINALAESGGYPLTVTFTNSIFYDITNSGTLSFPSDGHFIGDYLATNSATGITGGTHSVYLTASPFQTVYRGEHYLGNGSSLRNSGTTNINAALLASLRSLTTYPPLVYTNDINSTVVWSPIVERDNNTPDLGYHSAPIDYLVSALKINTNGVLYLTNGCVVAFDVVAEGWGFVFDGGKLISQGSPGNPNYILRTHCIQESSDENPGTRALFYDKGDDGQPHADSEVRFRFTELSQMAEDGYSMYTGKNFSQLEVSHSTMNFMVWIITADKGGQVFGFTNNITEWPEFYFDSGGTTSLVHMRNNLFRNNHMDFYNLTNTSTVLDNIFDSSDCFDHGHSVSNGWNAYFNTTAFLSGGVSNTNLVTLTYQMGPLGKYYQPSTSPLIDRGSITNSALIGFYYMTSTTNGVKETTSRLNIGNHYPSVTDTDSDGVSDFLEDTNGNGTVDSGETDWQSATDLGLRVLIIRPRNGTVIP